MTRSFVNLAFDTAQTAIRDLQNTPQFETRFLEMVTLLSNCLEQGHKILICGNGGSSCDAMHFAEEFTGRFRQNRKSLPVLAISDSAHITCVANDFGFSEVFARGVEAFGQHGDILVVLSTSGNSPNIIRALEQAKAQGLNTIAFLGKTGGDCLGKSDLEWVIPGTTSDRIQEMHMLMLHVAIEGVERRLFPDLYPVENT